MPAGCVKIQPRCDGHPCLIQNVGGKGAGIIGIGRDIDIDVERAIGRRKGPQPAARKPSIISARLAA